MWLEVAHLLLCFSEFWSVADVVLPKHCAGLPHEGRQWAEILCSWQCLTTVSLQCQCLHGITESFELEGTLKGHPVQLNCTEQGPQQLHRVLRAPSSLTLSVPGMGHHHLSGQPVPVPHHPYCKKLLYI